MRVIMMHKTNADNEAGIPPSAELIAAVGRMVGDLAATGAFETGAGLRQSALGVRLVAKDGRTTLTPGPFTGGNELTAALCVLEVKERDDAVAWASRFTEIVGDAEIDIRPVTEPWDLGVMPKPPGITTTKYMAVLKADRDFEEGKPVADEVRSAIERLLRTMKETGILVSAELLTSSAEGVRHRYRGGRLTVIDGPFAESKELIAGFVILRVNTLEEAIAWAPRYAAAVGDIEMDIRPLADVD